jgi:hypothetical protein
MRYYLVFILFCLSLTTKAQSKVDTPQRNCQYEYLSIIVDNSGKNSRIYISKDSSLFEKKTIENKEIWNLTTINGLLARYSKDGWIIQSSNFVYGSQDNYSIYFYYLLYRKKD